MFHLGNCPTKDLMFHCRKQTEIGNNYCIKYTLLTYKKYTTTNTTTTTSCATACNIHRECRQSQKEYNHLGAGLKKALFMLSRLDDTFQIHKNISLNRRSSQGALGAQPVGQFREGVSLRVVQGAACFEIDGVDLAAE